MARLVLRPVRKGNISMGRVFRKAAAGYRKERKRHEKKVQRMEIIGMPSMPTVIRAEAKEEAKRPAGIEIAPPAVLRPPRMPAIDFSAVNIQYPLIPRREPAFAYSNIRWSRPEASLIYYVLEPELLGEELALLEKIKSALIEKLDIDFSKLRKEEATGFLRQKFSEMVGLMAKGLPAERQKLLLYYVERDFIGLGKIEPLMQDPSIEDISCDGVGIPVFVFHRNPMIGSVRTNIVFEKAEELDAFVNKLAQRCGKTISVASPLVGASLPDGSRLQATLGTDIARRGSNFTIRKFTEEPLTPTHLLRFKTIDPKIAAYLWMAIEYGRSMLISGGVATGKTTLLNALSLFIKPELKIISIEDTAELRLPQPHWVPTVARQPIAEVGGRKLGEVDLFDLLRESLRQRPDFLIVGEVRGREAYVLFQQIATGHASMSTMHADSMERLMDRLTTPPISLPANLIESLDIIVFVVRIKYGTSYIRRVSNIYEITGFDREKNIPLVNEVFRWVPEKDGFEAVNPSAVLKKISDTYGLSEDTIKREVGQRTKVLEWALRSGVDNYRDFARVIKLYYSKPEELLAAV